MIPSTVDYRNRQIDVELLQTIRQPVIIQRVNVSNIQSVPKIVTGIEKTVQRYALTLLGILGSVKFNEGTVGTELYVQLIQGAIQNPGQLQHFFGVANALALRQLARDDDDVATFGELPADERIVVAALDDYSINVATGTISLTVLITTEAGDTLTFVIPVTAVR